MGDADPAPSPSPRQVLGCPVQGGAADPSPAAAPEELERETWRRSAEKAQWLDTQLGNKREIK